MSGIPIIGKVFEAIDKSPILKAVVIVAVIYFTASAASSYFAAEGATVAASGGSLATTTSASVSAVSTAGTGGAAVGGAAAGSTGITGAGAVGTAGMSAGTTASLGGTMTAAEIATAEAAATTLGSSSSAASFFTANPAMTMILGQGIAGAAQGYSAQEANDQTLKQRREEVSLQENARKDRGLMGYNYDGGYGGQPKGIVNSQAAPPVQATAAPQVAGNEIAAPTISAPTAQGMKSIVGSEQAMQPQAAPTQTPIQRSDLPKLNQNRV